MSITVMRAAYASNEKGLDVTAQCQNLVSAGQTVLEINNATFSDPDAGRVKHFMIQFLSPGLNGGHPICLACLENTQLDLALSPAPGVRTPPQPQLFLADGAHFQIVRAVYGTTGIGLDVTPICQALANQGGTSLTLTANNITFAIDPAPGIQKTFVIQYLLRGQTLQCGCVDFESVTLNA